MNYPSAVVTTMEPIKNDPRFLCVVGATVSLGPGMDFTISGLRVRPPCPPRNHYMQVACPTYMSPGGFRRNVVQLPRPAWAALNAAVLCAAAAAYPPSTTLETTP